ncbi:hypothetical protein HDV05_004337 [Chytridiales sp. JEL 0842]|nr:hypothetical protein HDV05_004337 [Chytridiales sp. JEL 0842]
MIAPKIALLTLASTIIMSTAASPLPSARDDLQQYTVLPKPAGASLVLDGSLTSPAWDSIPFTAPFIDMRGTSFGTPKFDTRVKMMYDSEYLYVGALMQETDVWGYYTENQSPLYKQNAFEVFFDPDNDGENYLEYEINAISTFWSLWLNKPWGLGGQGTDIILDGVIRKVSVQGTVNQPGDVDKSWSVELAFPWKVFAQFIKNDKQTLPPTKGDTWRMNFARMNWDTKVVNGTTYVKEPNTDDTNFANQWVWSSQNDTTIHKPEQWGFVTFV